MQRNRIRRLQPLFVVCRYVAVVVVVVVVLLVVVVVVLSQFQPLQVSIMLLRVLGLKSLSFLDNDGRGKVPALNKITLLPLLGLLSDTDEGVFPIFTATITNTNFIIFFVFITLSFSFRLFETNKELKRKKRRRIRRSSFHSTSLNFKF